MKTKMLSIAVVMDHAVSFNRQILAGIGAYARRTSNWKVVPFLAEAEGLSTTRCRACDGLIGHLFSAAMADAALKLRMPVVTVSGVLSEYPIPRVSADDIAVGRLAAEHFLDRGYAQFAFVGYPRFDFSQRRLAAFAQRLRESGASTTQLLLRTRKNANPSTDLLTSTPGLGKWILRQPRPLALFAANAMLGFRASIACHEVGLRIPDQVALLDVDNDELLAQLSSPPNSSVALATYRMGYDGASMLDRLIKGEELQTTEVIIPPIGVMVRQSTDVLAVEDEDVVNAARFIRDQVSATLSAGDVARFVAVSRSTLDHKFNQMVGHSLAEQIRRSRRERAIMLLASTDLSIAEVAQKAGYHGNIELSRDFRSNLGQTPTEYRQKFRVPKV